MLPTLVVATGNAHKTSEIRAMLEPRWRVIDLHEFPGAPAAVEDAPDFRGNAAKKAQTLAAWIARQNAPSPPDCILADDSGLEVDALAGAPGVHSARFAALDPSVAGNSPDSANNAKLLRLLQEVPAARRTARFRCVLALAPLAAGAGAPIEFFEGTCEGRLLDSPRGEHGFGYDPLFVPEGGDRTFAELSGAEKNRISHRARALQRLVARLAGAPIPR